MQLQSVLFLTDKNEDKVGVAIDEAIQSGKVKREDLFIVSKLWNTHHSKEHAKGALEQTLKDLKVDYVCNEPELTLSWICI